MDESKREDVARVMREINHAWLGNKIQDLSPLVHPDMVAVFPNFSGKTQGRDDLLSGFRDFSQNAKILEFREHDHQVDVAGETAVITFRYAMLYERFGKRYRSTGRDLWVFQKQGHAWLAVWRIMFDIEESTES